tara:strand:+ start:29 stop:412 length:384 start_codon:yes stop_codon:yes gene_type:complete
MGYTHYIQPTRNLTDQEWATLTAQVKQILDGSTVPLAGWDGTGKPEVSTERISFNGVNDDSHESCVINREETGFSFCKTARKPYDYIVGAVYLAFQEIHGSSILSSDGDLNGEEWLDARELFNRITS